MGRFVFKIPDVGEGTTEVEIVKWHVGVGDAVYYAAATFGGSVQAWNYTFDKGMETPAQLSPSQYQYCGVTISTDGKSSLAVAFSNSTSVLMSASTDLGSVWRAQNSLSVGNQGIPPLSLTSDYFITGSVLVMWSDVSPSLGTYQLGAAIVPFQ